MRVYQQIDKYIQDPDRQFFPKYYGATKLSRKLFPRWGYMGDTEDIPVIILELLDEKEIHNDQYELQISDSTRQVAQELYNYYGIDAEYVHIYIHCMEKIDILHGGRVVHRDIKPDVFMNCASVIIDFSHSWSWEDGKDEPCLDPFRRRQGPTTFESHSKCERDSFRRLVTEWVHNFKMPAIHDANLS
jgi:serine/threonine protein kinase